MSSAVKIYNIAKATDIKQAHIDAVGDVGKIRVMSGRVLIITYIASDKVGEKGLILRPDNNVREDVYQSVCGLVLKKGPLAFKDDENHKFHGQDVQVGDWVIFKHAEGNRIQINGAECRYMEDVFIDMVIQDPTMITHRKV